MHRRNGGWEEFEFLLKLHLWRWLYVFLDSFSELCRAYGIMAQITEHRFCFLGPLLQFIG